MMTLSELQKKDIINLYNDLWNRLIKSGDIYLSKYKGWYSVSDEAYYNPDEIVEKDGKKISTFSGSSGRVG